MKHISLAIAASVLALNSQACSITATYNDNIALQLKRTKGWTFDNYDEVCAKLERANAAVFVLSQATVLNNQSIGWAAVMIKDRGTGLSTSDFASLNTTVNSIASLDKAKELAWVATNDAMNGWTGIDDAIALLQKERAKVNGSKPGKTR